MIAERLMQQIRLLAQGRRDRLALNAGLLQDSVPLHVHIINIRRLYRDIHRRTVALYKLQERCTAPRRVILAVAQAPAKDGRRSLQGAATCTVKFRHS